MPKRPTSTKRGYDWAWYNLRKRHLRYNPRCIRCGARGTDVDHITSIAKAPHLRLEPSNLSTYCHSCHSKITQWNDNPHAKRNAQRGATVQGLPLDPRHPWAGQGTTTTTTTPHPWGKGR